MMNELVCELGVLLRGWRSQRGKSQLETALAADVSQRHLSFIESGRSVPGREKLLAIAEALDVPLRDRNALLLAAGYAPLYPEQAWDAPQMRAITAAAERMLKQQEPYPAVLLDRHWNVLAANGAAPRFSGRFVDLAKWSQPRNLLRLTFDPAGLRPFIHDWDQVARSLLDRVRREAIGRVLDKTLQGLVDTLLAYPGVPDAVEYRSDSTDMPMIPIGFVKDGTILRYFSMVTSVGAPTAIAAQELRIECLFPADEETERGHLRTPSAP
ncbi:transcriptional regulator with XRE-family HTH domain [Sphingomonas sp. BK580]|nr:transcriptional regulator with XRE-family HTH domain [Sphingomonas sp. BK580]